MAEPKLGIADTINTSRCVNFCAESFFGICYAVAGVSLSVRPSLDAVINVHTIDAKSQIFAKALSYASYYWLPLHIGILSYCEQGYKHGYQANFLRWEQQSCHQPLYTFKRPHNSNPFLSTIPITFPLHPSFVLLPCHAVFCPLPLLPEFRNSSFPFLVIYCSPPHTVHISHL